MVCPGKSWTGERRRGKKKGKKVKWVLGKGKGGGGGSQVEEAGRGTPLLGKKAGTRRDFQKLVSEGKTRN